MNNDDAAPEWAPRVPQWKIRRLYQNDAMGLYDDELIDDVGYSLLARCESFILANEATQGRAACPRCSSVITHSWNNEELLRCACGWQLTWGEYFETIQHQQLSGAEPVIKLFRDFIDRFPSARSARDKVLVIDRLIHGFHWHYKDASVTRPVAVNLIEGRLGQVIGFLDDLTCSDKSTPGIAETKAEWQKSVETARRWYRDGGI